jgi:hypothetical protein
MRQTFHEVHVTLLKDPAILPELVQEVQEQFACLPEGTAYLLDWGWSSKRTCPYLVLLFTDEMDEEFAMQLQGDPRIEDYCEYLLPAWTDGPAVTLEVCL